MNYKNPSENEKHRVKEILSKANDKGKQKEVFKQDSFKFDKKLHKFLYYRSEDYRKMF